jgi:hypothetical protein
VPAWVWRRSSGWARASWGTTTQMVECFATVHAATSISSGHPPGTLRGAPPPDDCYCTVCFAGHVDNLARFARPGVVVLTWCDDPSDPQYEVSRDALARLTAGTDARGRRLEVRATRSLSPCVSRTRGHYRSFTVLPLVLMHTHCRGELREIHTVCFAPPFLAFTMPCPQSCSRKHFAIL